MQVVRLVFGLVVTESDGGAADPDLTTRVGLVRDEVLEVGHVDQLDLYDTNEHAKIREADGNPISSQALTRGNRWGAAGVARDIAVPLQGTATAGLGETIALDQRGIHQHTRPILEYKM